MKKWLKSLFVAFGDSVALAELMERDIAVEDAEHPVESIADLESE